MAFYPLYIRLNERRCLLVGAGKVGQRKLASLLQAAPSEVLVLDPAPPDDELTRLLQHPAARFEQRPFRESDLKGRFLAFIATPDNETNQRIAALCRERGLLCNVADAPDSGDFIVPAQVCQGDLQVAVSTAGHSPALARRIRRDLQEYLGLRYDLFLVLMGRLRPLVLGLGRPTTVNTKIFRALVESPLAEALQNRDLVRARAIVRELLPPELHHAIDEVLHELP